jgi:hypothetical protein
MGRFYKTATPNKIDFMYQVPENMMLKAIDATDQRIAGDEAAIYDLYGKLQASALEKDKGRRDELLKGYESKIDELSQKFYENPLLYSNNKGVTRQLAKEIHEDWTRGEISNITGNYNARTEYIKRYQEEVTKGNVKAADFNNALRYFDSQFGGTNYDKEKGKGNIYGTEDLVARVSVEDIAEKRGKDYVSDLVKTWGAHTDGQYIYKSVDSKETIPYEHILQGVYNSLTNDKDVQDYYNQQVKFGVMTPEEVQASLQVAAERVAQKYDKNHIEKGQTDINANPYGLQKQKHELDKDMHAWKDTYENLKLMPSDRNNEQAGYDVSIGTSVQEIEGKLKDFDYKAKEPLNSLKLNLYSALDGKNLSPAEKTKMKQQIDAAYDAANSGNFNALNEVSGQLGYGAKDPKSGKWVGTGVSEAESIYRNYSNAAKNEKTLLDALKKTAEEDANIEIGKQINAYKEQLVKQGYKLDNPDGTPSRWFQDQVDRRRAELEKNKPNMVTQKVNSTLADPTFQKSYESVYSTAGNYYDIPEVHKKVFNDYMQNLPKNMMDFIARNGNSKVIRGEVKKGDKMEATSLDQLIRDGFITHEQIEELSTNPDGKITVASRSGGKPITYKIGGTRVVPQDLPGGLGRNAKQLTIEVDDPNRKIPQTITLYVPENDLPSPDAIQEVYRSQEVNTIADEMELFANIKFGNAVGKNKISVEDANYISPYSDNVTYNRFMVSSDGVKGLWTFQSGGKTVKVYGDAGKEMYKQSLRAAGLGDAYNPEKMNELTGVKTSTSGSESTTRVR